MSIPDDTNTAVGSDTCSTGGTDQFPVIEFPTHTRFVDNGHGILTIEQFITH